MKKKIKAFSSPETYIWLNSYLWLSAVTKSCIHGFCGNINIVFTDTKKWINAVCVIWGKFFIQPSLGVMNKACDKVSNIKIYLIFLKCHIKLISCVLYLLNWTTFFNMKVSSVDLFKELQTWYFERKIVHLKLFKIMVMFKILKSICW